MALALKSQPGFSVRSAANPELLPKPEPRTMREHFIVPSIRSRQVTRVQRPNIRSFEHFLYLFDVVNSAFNVHALQSSDRRRGAVNLKWQLA
jgi:hypothetical protein